MMRSSSMARAVLSLLAAVLLSASAAEASLIYVVDSQGALATADPSTGQCNVIQNLPQVMGDIAVSPQGQLLGADAANVLWQIDPNTATERRVGPIGYYVNAMTFGSDGTLFGAAGSRLYTISPATAAATIVGTFAPSISAGDLEFDPAGDLYLTTNDGHLLRLDPKTAQPTVVGSTGLNDIFGLAFVDGTMYALADGEKAVLSIDLNSGAATVVAPLSISLSGAYGASAGVPLHSTTVPEPAGLLPGAALCLLALNRTRRRAA